MPMLGQADSSCRGVRVGIVAGRDGQAEVHDFYLAVASKHHVGRFQITVDNTGCVSLRKCVGHLPCDIEQRVRGQAALAAQSIGERFAIHQFHRDVGRSLLHRHVDRPNLHVAVDFADFVNRANVGMIQSCRCPGLTEQTGAILGVFASVVWQELQCHESMKEGVFGLINDTHASGAQLGN